ncbi:hypothetical protein LCGC14_3112760, partial [marine sediment metagenome]
TSKYNKLTKAKGAKVGVLASGLAVSYTKEALKRLKLENKVNFMKLGLIFPIPASSIKELLNDCEVLIVIEEGDPVVELQVSSLAQEIAAKITIHGKKSNPILKPFGEINTDLVAGAIAGVLQIDLEADERQTLRAALEVAIAPRSSTLCAGCSHFGSYWALKTALKEHKGVHIINGDIGCYEQGGYGLFASKINVNDEDSKRYPVKSVYEILDTIYVMGSGIGLAQGQAQVGYNEGKVVAVAGDSTFIQATLPSVANAVYSKADITFLVFDNRWTAMTGHQVNPCTGLDTLGNACSVFNIAGVAKSLGVEYVETANAYDLEEAEKAIAGALVFKGPAIGVLKG